MSDSPGREFLTPDRFELREALPYRFQVSRREFLESAGAGLLILVSAPDVTQSSPRQAGGASASLEGRLHIGKDGRVTVFTGKVEEGQGPRTELTLAAAEEMRLHPDRILLLMADTDLVPNDGITAGSRTTPATVPVVRRAGAVARELLLSAASRRFNADRASLEVRDGAVTLKDARFTYGDLAASPELSTYKEDSAKDVPVTSPAEWKVLGKPHVRVDGREIVTGVHRYPSDIVRPGMLYGSVLRPPAYGAVLEHVDTSAAAGMPGVTLVRDGEFAGCAAPTSFAARKAVQSLAAGARWKSVEHPDSDTLFEYLKLHARDDGQPARTRGSVEEALQSAQRRVKASFQVGYVQHAPMEPRAAVAEWEGGRLTVWTGTSNPFGTRDQLAQAFKLQPQNVRVIVPDMGGGFGGKHTGEAAIEAARLARETRRPVLLRWTRTEEFTCAYFRPAALIEIEAGLDRSNLIQAWDFSNYNSGTAALDTPYRIPNTRVRFLQSDSPLRQGSYRCLAATANNFAREAFTDELAEAAGKDPLEFRLAHLEEERLKNVLVAAAERFGWAERRRKPRAQRTGIGLACGTEKNSVVAACVEVEVSPGGGPPRVLQIVEAFECGPILNPAGLRAQVEGCIMMGLGPALREEIRFKNGRLLNGRFSSYRVPRFADVPKIDLVLLDRKDLEPAGAGETPIIAVAPAIANAVFDATSTRARSMPISVGGGPR
jgi:isoquinoline 1-oxidoreductase subunit beta